MLTCEWHSLDHLVDELRDVRGMKCVQAKLYESSHREFRANYKNTSKRTASVLGEISTYHNKAARFTAEGYRKSNNPMGSSLRHNRTHIEGVYVKKAILNCNRKTQWENYGSYVACVYLVRLNWKVFEGELRLYLIKKSMLSITIEHEK